MTTARQLADAFKRHMQEELGLDLCFEVDRENKRRGDDGTCASHDHCDANMVMDAAAQGLGVHMFPDDAPEDFEVDQEVVDLWNAAWSLARAEGFTSV